MTLSKIGTSEMAGVENRFAAGKKCDQTTQCQNSTDNIDISRFVWDYYYNRFTALWILSGTTQVQVSRYQKGKTNLDFTEASGCQWHQLGHMQICTLLQTDNHTSTQPLSFLQAGCPSCHPTNSIKAPRLSSLIQASTFMTQVNNNSLN